MSDIEDDDPDKLTLNGRSLCLDTVINWMSAEETGCYIGPYAESKWRCLRSVRSMIRGGYCRETMIVLFEETLLRVLEDDETEDILEWLLSGDEA